GGTLSASRRLGQRLVVWIAGADVREGRPEPHDLRAAIHAKSNEDVAVAQEWIERGGDYERAIAILDRQQHADPGYAPLERALEQARTMRLVTPQRFARVQPGMSRTEVRAALGPVNLRNVVARPTERVEAWFYPR